MKKTIKNLSIYLLFVPIDFLMIILIVAPIGYIIRYIWEAIKSVKEAVDDIKGDSN